MNLGEFLSFALEPPAGVRKGQRFSNELHRIKPELGAALNAADLDPFYDDSRLWAAVVYVRDNWSKT